jgi:hypothetical protein
MRSMQPYRGAYTHLAVSARGKRQQQGGVAFCCVSSRQATAAKRGGGGLSCWHRGVPHGTSKQTCRVCNHDRGAYTHHEASDNSKGRRYLALSARGKRQQQGGAAAGCPCCVGSREATAARRGGILLCQLESSDSSKGKGGGSELSCWHRGCHMGQASKHAEYATLSRGTYASSCVSSRAATAARRGGGGLSCWHRGVSHGTSKQTYKICNHDRGACTHLAAPAREVRQQCGRARVGTTCVGQAWGGGGRCLRFTGGTPVPVQGRRKMGLAECKQRHRQLGEGAGRMLGRRGGSARHRPTRQLCHR